MFSLSSDMITSGLGFVFVFSPRFIMVTECSCLQLMLRDIVCVQWDNIRTQLWVLGPLRATPGKSDYIRPAPGYQETAFLFLTSKKVNVELQMMRSATKNEQDALSEDQGWGRNHLHRLAEESLSQGVMLQSGREEHYICLYMPVFLGKGEPKTQICNCQCPVDRGPGPASPKISAGLVISLDNHTRILFCHLLPL